MSTTPKLTAKQRDFILSQHMFFVGSAPMTGGEDGHVNISPKGLSGSFAILDDSNVAYLDFTGSGVETIAHIRENKRVCIMFCAFEGSPNILRIHGKGRVVLPDDDAFENMLQQFEVDPQHVHGIRSIICVTAQRINDSCGFGVPLYEYQGQRTRLTQWVQKKGAQGVADYQSRKNLTSLDGLPGLDR
ncbi:MAG: pyridoxamine 5'-phosphate oxidase family protein [Phycisphaeraceae bacterium JB051]